MVYIVMTYVESLGCINTNICIQGEVMNSVEAAPAAVGVAAPMVVPSEPVSIVVDEKLMVVLNKDGGVESMEINGGMALQVLLLPIYDAELHSTELVVVSNHICQQQCCESQMTVVVALLVKATPC